MVPRKPANRIAGGKNLSNHISTLPALKIQADTSEILNETDGLGFLLVCFLLAAHDTDTGKNAEIVYRIVGGIEGGEFQLNSKTGLISTTKPLDAEKSALHTLTVSALDQINRVTRRQSAVKVIIEVIDANDNAPIFECKINRRPNDDHISTLTGSRNPSGYVRNSE
jgi:hypothetical protein